MSRPVNVGLLWVILFAIGVPSAAQRKPSPAPEMSALEKRAELSIASVRQSPLELRNLLLKMPKGSDLHTHLYGAINAETWINNAAEDHLCVDTSAMRGTTTVFSAGEGEPPSCPAGKVPATEVFQNQRLYDELVNAFSIRGFVPTPGFTAHDQFFATFARCLLRTVAASFNCANADPSSSLSDDRSSSCF